MTAVLLFEPHERQAQRLARLRESREILQGARRIHDVARNSFQAMLDEARAHDHKAVNHKRPIASSTDRADHQSAAFVAELMRLEGEIRQVNQQLDRLEAELMHTRSDLARERFEGYR